MPQDIHMLAVCFLTVALSIVATLVCLNEKGKVNETLSHCISLQRLGSCNASWLS